MALLLPISVKPSHIKTLEHSQTLRYCPKSSKVNFTFEFDLWYLSNIIYIYISTYIIPHFLTNDTTGEALAQVPSTLVSSLQFDQTRRRQKPGILPSEIRLRSETYQGTRPAAFGPSLVEARMVWGAMEVEHVQCSTSWRMMFPSFVNMFPYFSIFSIFLSICFHIFMFKVLEHGKIIEKNNYGTWTIIENHRTYSFFQLFQSIGTWKIIDLQFRSRVSAKKNTTQTQRIASNCDEVAYPLISLITNMQCPKLKSHPPSAKPTLFIFFHFMFFGFPCLERPCLRSRSNSPGSGLHP